GLELVHRDHLHVDRRKEIQGFDSVVDDRTGQRVVVVIGIAMNADEIESWLEFQHRCYLFGHRLADGPRKTTEIWGDTFYLRSARSTTKALEVLDEPPIRASFADKSESYPHGSRVEQRDLGPGRIGQIGNDLTQTHAFSLIRIPPCASLRPQAERGGKVAVLVRNLDLAGKQAVGIILQLDEQRAVRVDDDLPQRVVGSRRFIGIDRDTADQVDHGRHALGVDAVLRLFHAYDAQEGW